MTQPTTMKSVSLGNAEGAPGKVYLPLVISDVPIPTPTSDQVLVRILAAALNRRDLFSRQKLYPGVAPGIPLLADGVGTVVSAGSPKHQDWVGKRVVIYPARGWESAVEAPDGQFAILGGTKHYPDGTLQEYIALDPKLLVPAPAHLTTGEAAALPLAGVTAWRATFTKGQVSRGQNVLVTGIGGGVALAALSFAHAAGATVFVTSGEEAKIRKAKELGASAGVIYKDADWDKKLREVLPKGRPYLDVVIDGTGGDIVKRATALLKPGGKIVSYGMTLGPKIEFQMGAVLKQIDLLGSTMGSQKEFAEMVKFVFEKQLRPVVSKEVRGFERVDELFDIMKVNSQFGKLVVVVADEDSSKASRL